MPWSLAVKTMSREGNVVWIGPPSTEESHLFLICVKQDKCKHITLCTLNCLGQNCGGRGQVCGFGDWICCLSYLLSSWPRKNIKNGGGLHIKTQRKYHQSLPSDVRGRESVTYISNLLLGNSLHMTWIWLWLYISKGDSGKFGYPVERLFNWKFSRG